MSVNGSRRVACFPHHTESQMSVDGSHRVACFPHHTQFSKVSTPHTMSDDGSHRVACFPHHTECLLTDHTESHVFHITQIVGSHEVARFPRCINHHDISKLSTSHTIFATSIFVITKLSINNIYVNFYKQSI